MEMNENIKCPICQGSTIKVQTLQSRFIYQKLSEHFQTPVSEGLDITDYNMMQCKDCTFEFAFPSREGSASFYDWVTARQGYYPGKRWEYSKVIELLETIEGNLRLLDVGCGDGQFFDAIAESGNSRISLFGLDPTGGSAEICKTKGYEVFCMDIEGFKSSYKGPLFDVVSAFHVLEHIGDPLHFLHELTRIIRPGGTLFISTPYSPMDFELEWYDVLNHPPHHMGRWNLKSYEKIAATLGLDMQVFMPEAGSLLKSAIRSLMFSQYGSEKVTSKARILGTLIGNPLAFINHYKRQSKRMNISGKRASNVILLNFTRRL
jgi:2-polyprenyl-3-methyl-5-hydroxy-6-metoxy-1,4-benzoquinol methylase